MCVCVCVCVCVAVCVAVCVVCDCVSIQGESQFITLNFKRAVCAHEVHITFQGGFVGQVCCSVS